MQHENERKKSEELKLDGNRVPVAKAVEATSLWRKIATNHLGDNVNEIKSFFIPMEDLKSLVDLYQDLGVTGARAYIGVVPNANSSCSDLKLFLCPATEAEDFYKNYPGGEAENSSSIYDFTMPCPNSCPKDNELNS
ncbi:hypothetical protein ACSBL2_19015 [Pedobacter sp. AW31-3R]|uniref:hypothetical protein n=1 Tax=Pedobacter sp. AW31-3R TaxID=3445781 RepID=UPI003FA00A21